MNANNPFGKGSDKSGKGDEKAEQAARRVQKEDRASRSGIGQRKGKPAQKPGVDRAPAPRTGGTMPPGLPKGTTGGSRSGRATRKGCAAPVGVITLIVVAGALLQFLT